LTPGRIQTEIEEMSNEADRRAAVVVIHGSDDPVALASFEGWIKSGHKIGFEKISRLSDAIAKAREEGEQAGLEKTADAALEERDRAFEEVARLLDTEAFFHETDTSKYPPPLPGEEGFARFYGLEYARALLRAQAARVRSMLSTATPTAKPATEEGGWTKL
jgi:hypothetical protein